MNAAEVPTENVERRFRRLAKSWRADVECLSSVDEMTSHPDYMSIIALGSDVVPILLHEIETHPDHWFSALAALTSANPLMETRIEY